MIVRSGFQNLDMNPGNMNNLTNKVLITVFSMIAELERDFISQKTKKAHKRRAQNKILRPEKQRDKPKE